MQCKQCGAALDERAVFCSVCGEKQAMDGPAPQSSGKSLAKTQPLPPTKKRVVSIVAAGVAVVVLAFIGNRFLGNGSFFHAVPAAAESSFQPDAAAPQANDVQTIRPDYRDQGDQLLALFTDIALKEEALAVGTAAWQDRAQAARQQLDAFAQGAENDLESRYALAVSKLSIYALANHYESVMVAEQGGRSDATANAVLAKRYENVPALLETLCAAETLEALQAVCDACDGKQP